MKKLFLILSLITSICQLKAQTKEETEEWIVSKLNKCVISKIHLGHVREKFDYETSIPGYTYYLDDCWVDQEYTYFRIENGKLKFTMFEFPTINPSCKNGTCLTVKNRTILWSIPISEITKIYSFERTDRSWYWINDPQKIDNPFWLRINCYTYSATYEAYREEGKAKSVAIPFRFKMEDDLELRLEKAFDKLATFYPRKKEAF